MKLSILAKRPMFAALAGLALIVAAAVWWIDTRSPDAAAPRVIDGVVQDDSGQRVLYWYDPMVPDRRFQRPGKSPFMDMQLVPKYANESDSGLVTIDPRAVHNFGVRTAPVVRGTLGASAAAVGTVEVDERRIVAVEARAAGWIERLDVRAMGDPVRRGQRLADVYSPDLYAAQQELLLAARAGDAALREAASRRLTLLGMSEAQLRRVLSSGRAQREVAVLAPTDGIVTELNAREGQQVAPALPLMRIADLSRVWITIEAPESQAPLLRAGEHAEARLRALPGRVFVGEVEYVYPRLDETTRTLRARLAFGNPSLALKPGMFADVTLHGAPAGSALLVPTEAVIRTGRGAHVIVAEGAGRFRPVPVRLGPEGEDRIVILRGLAEGQQVVVSGQFLIDSEANLRGAFGRMSAP